jgi:hypothetical protein
MGEDAVVSGRGIITILPYLIVPLSFLITGIGGGFFIKPSTLLHNFFTSRL